MRYYCLDTKSSNFKMKTTRTWSLLEFLWIWQNSLETHTPLKSLLWHWTSWTVHPRLSFRISQKNDFAWGLVFTLDRQLEAFKLLEIRSQGDSYWFISVNVKIIIFFQRIWLVCKYFKTFYLIDIDCLETPSKLHRDWTTLERQTKSTSVWTPNNFWILLEDFAWNTVGFLIP